MSHIGRNNSYKDAVESTRPIKPSRPPPPVQSVREELAEFNFDFEHFSNPTSQFLDYYLNQRKEEYTSPQKVIFRRNFRPFISNF